MGIQKLISLILVTILTIPVNAYAGGYVWEAAWIDLYKTVDKGSFSIRNELMANEISWSAQKIANMSVNYWKYIDTSKDFTWPDLESIVYDWNTWLLLEYIKKNEKWGYIEWFDSNVAIWLTKDIFKYYDDVGKHIFDKENKIAKIASIWLFSDWDINNSWYDLMYDLEEINKVIFSKDIPYNWVLVNDWSNDAAAIVWWGYNSLWTFPDISSEALWYAIWSNSFNPYGTIVSWSTWSLVPVWSTTTTAQTTLPINQSNSCNSGSIITWTDDSLIWDIVDQLSSWTNSNTTQWWEWNTSESWTPTWSNWGSSKGYSSWAAWAFGWDVSWWSLFDSFECSDFICINIDMIMYTQNLLGWGKTNSIEWILTKNFKIIDKISSQSLIQSNMTKNFFSLSILKSLKLPSMVSLGVVLSWLPPPILNLQPKEKKDEDTSEFSNENILVQMFQQNGLDYKNQNDLNLAVRNKAITWCFWLTTDECNAKVESFDNFYMPDSNMLDIMFSKVSSKYRWTFSDDIVQLKWFWWSLYLTIDSIINAFNKVKWKNKC